MISCPVAKPEPIRNAMIAPAYVRTRSTLLRSVECKCVFFCCRVLVIRILSNFSCYMIYLLNLLVILLVLYSKTHACERQHFSAWTLCIFDRAFVYLRTSDSSIVNAGITPATALG